MTIQCPFCDSTDNERFSLYGQTLLGTQYYCHTCKSIFEAIRYDEATVARPAGFNAADTPVSNHQNPSGLEKP
ncbi:MAG: hypothetical protein H6658_10910 [Ardenticatenaceae bacterium]|nr:hypothetical protein [Ardenticatenaceae bacterium]